MLNGLGLLHTPKVKSTCRPMSSRFTPYGCQIRLHASIRTPRALVTQKQIREAITLAARLKLALAAKGLTSAALAKAIKVKRQTVYYWVDGTTKSIDSDNLAAAAKVLGVRSDWLRDGGDVMYPQPELTEHEVQLVGMFRDLPAEQQKHLMDIAETFATKSAVKPSPATPYRSKVRG